MKAPIPYLAALLLLFAVFHASAPRAEILYLDANFNDKTIDAPIGTGGASLGEPYFVTTDSYVRSTPMATPALELQDGSDCCWENIWFRFVGNARISSGVAVMTVNLWIAETSGTAGEHRIEIRQSDPEVFFFVTISFLPNGSILLTDADGQVGEIGQYETGRVLPLAVAIDLDAHTYDVWLDSQMVIDDETIVSMTDQGVEQLLFGTSGDADLLGRFYIDDLRVTDDPDAVPVLPASWGMIRALFSR